MVIEKDPSYVGGLARTVEHNGYRFDIGGHRFFSKNQEVEDLWTEVMQDEMLTRGRLSRIHYRGRFYAYPIKAFNALWNLGPVEAVRCLVSYAYAKVRPIKNARSLEDWVRNQFGWRLYSIFFKTYTEKVWGISTKELSADWAAQRIKSLDLGLVIRSALLPKRKPRDRGEIVTTLIDRFRYPRLGPGQMWERVTSILESRGRPVLMGRTILRIEHRGGLVRTVVARNDDGAVEEYAGSQFVSSIPMRELVRLQKAYPVYDDVYQARVQVIRDYLAKSLPNLHVAGRNGMHKYNNQDHSMMTALLVARAIATGSALDPWKVNADAVYHEDIRVGEKDLSGRHVPERLAGVSR